MPFEFESRTFHKPGSAQTTTHIQQNGRNVTINGKPVRGLRKWMVYAGVALAWLGLLAAIPLLAFVVLLLGLGGWAVYIITR